MAAHATTATDHLSTSRFSFSVQYAQLQSLQDIRQTLLKMGLAASAQLHFVYVNGRFGIEWTQVQSAPRVQSGILTFYTNGSLVQTETITSQQFPPSSAGMILVDKPENSKNVRVSVTLTISGYNVPPTAGGDVEIAAEALANNLREQTTNDVRFTFAATEGTLWVPESVANKVPHFKTILSSSFREGSAKNLGASATPPTLKRKERTFDDSDDDTDDLLKSSYPARIKTTRKPLAPAKTIEITGAAYSTYAAVLLWLASRRIDFAPLKSNGVEKRVEQLKRSLEASSALPAPASPKSVYRLAHLLELEELQKLALSAFKDQLNDANAVHELFSDAAQVYTELRDAASAYGAGNITGVKKSAGWAEMKKRAEGDDLQGASSAAHALMELVERLKGSDAQST